MAPLLDPAREAAIRESFARQGLMQHLGATIVRLAPGEAVLRLPYGERVTQQQGSFHGGAIGALADIAGGYAAMTVVEPGMEVAAVEFKINFLAAFRDGLLEARGRVLRAGKRIIVTAADVSHHADDGTVSDCAVLQQTIAPVPKRY
jgi:uncharacterized protein (TIGR00369 family)